MILLKCMMLDAVKVTIHAIMLKSNLLIFIPVVIKVTIGYRVERQKGDE